MSFCQLVKVWNFWQRLSSPEKTEHILIKTLLEFNTYCSVSRTTQPICICKIRILLMVSFTLKIETGNDPPPLTGKSSTFSCFFVAPLWDLSWVFHLNSFPYPDLIKKKMKITLCHQVPLAVGLSGITASMLVLFSKFPTRLLVHNRKFCS